MLLHHKLFPCLPAVILLSKVVITCAAMFGCSDFTNLGSAVLQFLLLQAVLAGVQGVLAV